MFIGASGVIHPGLTLLTLGASCRYLLAGTRRTVLIGGASFGHAQGLGARLAQFDVTSSNITSFAPVNLEPWQLGILSTSNSTGRPLEFLTSSSILPALRSKDLPDKTISGDAEFIKLLPGTQTAPSRSSIESALSQPKVLSEGEPVAIDDDLSIKPLLSPGYSASSLCWLIEPYRFLIVDPSFGFYRGRELATPGGAENLEQSLATVKAWQDQELGGICFPFGGVISGEFVPRYLSSIIQNAQDLIGEVAKARADGVPEEEISSQVLAGLYSTTSGDPMFAAILRSTGERVMRQLRPAV